MSESKSRIEFIDLAKGICIMLVVATHSGISMPDFFQFFRMPLYFVLSGIFFKEYGGIINLLIKKVNKLIVPFLFFYTVSYFFVWIMKMINSSLWPYEGNLLKEYILGHNLNGEIWFLLCLFWLNVLFFFIHRLVAKEIWRFLTVVLINTIGVILWSYGIKIPGYVSTALGTISLFYFGSVLKQAGLLLPDKTRKAEIFTVLVGLFFLIIAHCLLKIYPCYVVWTYEAIHGNYVSVYLCSVLIVFGTLLISKPIKKLPIISYCGRYSIMILGMHGVFLRFTSFMPQYIGNTQGTYWLRFAIVLFFSVCCIPLLRRFFPYLTAQKDIFKINRTNQ